jgi:hypothetical protein
MPAGDPEQQQGTDDVNTDVDEAIAADVEPAERVVDRERQADERTPGKRRSTFGRRERRGDMPDLLVDDDRMVVVERERRREDIQVNGKADKSEDKLPQLLPPRWSRTW